MSSGQERPGALLRAAQGAEKLGLEKPCNLKKPESLSAFGTQVEEGNESKGQGMFLPRAPGISDGNYFGRKESKG